MTFGCQLRLRLPLGFEIEDSPVERVSKVPLQLAPYLSSSGLMGPAYAMSESSSSSATTTANNHSGLWNMGTCDPFTSFTVDLQASARVVKDRFHVDGLGEMAVRPVLQTCFAYTSIETDGKEDDPTYYTVRKMKISNLALPLVDEVEPIYDNLDLEALASILFHKISLDAYLTGFVSSQTTAELWLQSLLMCVYQSAQVEQARIEEEKQKTHATTTAAAAASSSSFIASERLLDQNGDLEAQEVLLGYGHPKIAAVPLLLYALMQCDALRPGCGSFQPSMDARVCAMTQMASMPPSVLAKAIAPSVLLWSLKDDEVIVESLPLSKSGIVDAIEGLLNVVDDGGGDDDDDDDGIVLIDSPRQVLLQPVKYFRVDKKRKPKQSKGNNNNNNNKNKSSSVLKIGPNLEACVLSCLKGYRTMPMNWKEIESVLLQQKRNHEVPSYILDSFFLEDKPVVATGYYANFSEWKMEMALLVQEELEKSGDI